MTPEQAQDEGAKARAWREGLRLSRASLGLEFDWTEIHIPQARSLRERVRARPTLGQDGNGLEIATEAA